MSYKGITPILKIRSDFYKKYNKMSVADMLREHHFMVHEIPIDDEDIVHFEEHKKFILENIGISDIPFNVKQEFVAEYQLSTITSIFVEGRYIRKATGEKMYESYFYTFYKEGFLLNGRKVNRRTYAEQVTRFAFLKIFEKQSGMFKKI